QTLDERWGIPASDLLRVAAKALEAWVKELPIPADHYYGPDFIKVDQQWYPAEPDGSPAIALDPYIFEVQTDEFYPAMLDWPLFNPERRSDEPQDTPPVSHTDAVESRIVFGFTLDVFPGMLIVGYNQVKHKVAEAGLRAAV